MSKSDEEWGGGGGGEAGGFRGENWVTFLCGAIEILCTLLRLHTD